MYFFARVASFVQRNWFVYEHQNNYIYFYQRLNEFNKTKNQPLKIDEITFNKYNHIDYLV